MEERFEELDDTLLNTFSQTGWTKIVDTQYFSDHMTAEDNAKFAKLTSNEMTGRYVFLLVSTKIDWRASNHHVGQGA